MDVENNNSDLQRYGIIMSYLQYENGVYWQRGNFFLVASAALLGFVATKLPILTKAASWELLITILIVSITGIFLSFLWQKGLAAGEFWIDHWHYILEDLEESAFPNHKVLKDFQPRPGGLKRVSAKFVAKGAMYLFYILWGLLGLHSVLVIGYKLCY